jgi:exonuclease SbcC
MPLAHSMTDIAGQAIGSRLEAMFIDEGFGTLDPATLDAVIDALERLRDSERMVGVVTDVSQLAERIPDGFAIERSGTGSHVRTRWSMRYIDHSTPDRRRRCREYPVLDRLGR